jgi:phenylalanyl-tRNA synthetase beta chain
MKFTLAWLKRHLKTNKTAQEIVDALNAIGFEVESTKDFKAIYEPFIIAEILATTPHPNAEKLRVCQVFNGQQELQIVCGAPNARAGIKVILAPVGAYIPGSGITIKQSQIRGIESCGMLCSGTELLISSDDEGIVELASDAVVGTKFYEHANLADFFIEISVTPNRGDATSVYGLARDLAAKGMGELIPMQLLPNNGPKHGFKVINNAPEHCFEFIATPICGIDNSQANSEYVSLLKLIGSSQKTPCVDLSNFSMFDYGRPNHIYDLDKIKGDLEIRESLEGETFIPINGEAIKLSAGLLVIADHEKICCLAGVMGGELSKVDENTKNILVEVANFSAEAVTNSGRKLNIHSDSRYRFERRVDGSITSQFMNLLTNRLISTVGGTLYGQIVANGTMPTFTKQISWEPSYFASLAGIELAAEEQYSILKALGFAVNDHQITIPPHRYGDIERKQDIVEEILRIYGFDKLPSQSLTFTPKITPPHKASLIRNRLLGSGLYELISWSFYSESTAKLFGFTNSIKIDNPISLELSQMRQSLIATLIEPVIYNHNRSEESLAFFELGKVYKKDGETNCIAGLRFGNYAAKTPHNNLRGVNFYDLKADAFAVISALEFDPFKLQYSREVPSYYHPGKSMALRLGKNLIGYIGEIHPEILGKLKLKAPCAAFEIFYDNLPEPKFKNARPKFMPSQYQSAERDFAFILDQSIESFELIKAVRALDQKLIEGAFIFDSYAGKNIESGKKSLALRVVMRSSEKTLTDEEINQLADKITTLAASKFNASLRA